MLIDKNLKFGARFASSDFIVVWGDNIFTHRNFILKHGADALNKIARFDHPSFNLHRPFGEDLDALGRSCLNLGAYGGTLLAIMLEEIDDKIIDAFFEYSSDRDEFWLWARLMSNLFNRTTPENYEQRAQMFNAWQANAEMIAFLGIPAPAWVARTATVLD